MEGKLEMPKDAWHMNIFGQTVGEYINEQVKQAEEKGYQRCLKEQRDREKKQLSSWMPINTWFENNTVKIKCVKNSSQTYETLTLSFPTCGSELLVIEWNNQLYGLRHISSKGNSTGGCGNG